MTLKEIRRKWKPRKKTSHKGDFGRIFILAGSRGLTGAAYLTSVAAVKTGAGLVTLGVPEKVYPILARRSAEVMVRPFPSTPAGSLSSRGLGSLLSFLKTQDVLALGPGLSQNKDTQKLIRSLFLKSKKPVVMDADGMNAFKGRKALLKKRKGESILTPHPGEFLRVFGGRLSDRDSDRKKRTLESAKCFRGIMVLKGHHSMVADRKRSYLNQTGNPGMATGGSGDVLTGIIAALVGQGLSSWDAARFGVYLHGKAGDLAAKKVGQISLTAGDILDALPEAVRKVTGR